MHREDQQHFRPDLPGQGSRPDRRVYQDLGFRLGKRDDHQLTCYVNWFWVTFTTHHDGEPGPGPVLYLKVDDIYDFYGAVLARGFTPSSEPRKDRSSRREFFLVDPDGNRLAFFAK